MISIYKTFAAKSQKLKNTNIQQATHDTIPALRLHADNVSESH